MLFASLLILSISSLAMRRMIVIASPSVIYVSPGQSIQTAINTANPGDTIFVYSGTYTEDISLNKDVYLVGEDRDSTILFSVKASSTIDISANGASVSNFTIRNTSPAGNGIFIHSVGNVTISNTEIMNSYDGLVTYTSLDDQIWGNIFVNNSDSGMGLYISSNSVISDNNISQNSVGVTLYSSINNVFSGNTISGNGAGLNLVDSSNNDLFYHNNFINPIQVLSDSNDTWSYLGEGNYWSNYVGHDAKGDGIGDIPYNVAINNVDPYPLVGTFYDFTASSLNLTFNVFIESNTTVSSIAYEVGQETGNKIIHFDVADEAEGTGFCRLMIPNGLMSPPYIVLNGEGEGTYKQLSATNATNTYLYLTYSNANQTITLISSETLQLYQQLAEELFGNQTTLLGYLQSLNVTSQGLLANNTNLLALFNQLLNSYESLNSSYQQQLSAYSANTQDLQNLTYIFAATTVVFLITTVYLSRRAHTRPKQRTSDS